VARRVAEDRGLVVDLQPERAQARLDVGHLLRPVALADQPFHELAFRTAAS
jgi:hypothetical protein